MCAWGPLIHDAISWGPAWLVILVTNLFLTWRARPLGKARWLVAGCALSAPAFFPDRTQYVCPSLAVLDTFITALAIVAGVRLADYDRAVARPGVDRWRLFAWLSLPVVGLGPAQAHGGRRWSKGASYLLRAVAKRLSWDLLAFLSAQGPLPWAFKSALLIFYFVLNLTAFHDLVLGLCVLGGLRGDELFDAPLLSRSPRDFWSRRWNKFISRFALKYVALKWGSRASVGTTLVLVFACSGLFHEYLAWGVGGFSQAPGAMMAFFLVQAGAVWAGTWFPWTGTAWITQPLCFLWMVATAPLFFIEITPALLAFGFPRAWLPFDEGMFWGWVRTLHHFG